MNRKSKLGLLIASFFLLVGILVLWRYSEVQGAKRELNHERCADEAHAMVAEFLRTDQVEQKVSAQKGRFVRLAKSGYSTPGPWNLQGCFYLSLHRSAYFTGGTEQLQIMVTRGDTKRVFQPRPGYPMIYVSHPDLWEN